MSSSQVASTSASSGELGVSSRTEGEQTPLLSRSNIQDTSSNGSRIPGESIQASSNNYESTSDPKKHTSQPSAQKTSSISQSTGSNIRPVYPQGYRVPTSRLGPQRTSYTTQKLKLLPDEPFPEDQESGREVYSQVTRIKDTPARKDAERLGKAHRAVLPRVTAYCTASSYKMKDLARYLAGRKGHKASPKLFDECLYTTYTYKRSGTTHDRNSVDNSDAAGSSSSNPQAKSAGLMRLDDEGGEIDVELTGRSDVFLFEYGVVVFWGFTEDEEKRFLKELAKFENEKLADEDIQVEEFNYYITKSYQPRVRSF